MSWATRARALLLVDPRYRRYRVAAALYALTSLVFLIFAAPSLLAQHTPYNHFALLAEAWLEGRLHLAGEPPAYTGNNDFAYYAGRWYVAFPPFPAALLLPAVWLAGGQAVRVADGLWFLALAGVAPAVLFLVLEKLKRLGESQHTEREHVFFCLLFAFGSVYFFSAVQGTVWYAAHSVAAMLLALYLCWALGAEHPFAAGLVLGLGFLTRAPLLFAAPLFVLEAWRVCRTQHDPNASLDVARFVRVCLRFLAPLVLVCSVALVLNQLRFDDFSDFGYRHLAIRWQGRIERWGLFHYHYLAKNLGVVLTSLPWLTPEGHPAPFQINAHGLALWLTTPLYLWLLWPRRRSSIRRSLLVAACSVALPTLFYQNTGWVQFGYRFSNDYSLLLFALLATAGVCTGWLFRTCAVLAVAINAFGALSFNRPEYRAYYYIEPTQRVLYQPD